MHFSGLISRLSMAVTGAVSCIGVKTVRSCSDLTRRELVLELYTDNNSFLAC